MGECGCADTNPKKVMSLGDFVVVLDVYMGCEYCFTGLGTDVLFFTKEGAEYYGYKPEGEIIPDEFGSLFMPTLMFDEESLKKAIKENSPFDYSTITKDRLIDEFDFNEWVNYEWLNVMRKAYKILDDKINKRV